MDLQQLRTLVAVAESGSLTAASRALHVSQPALTRRIAALERSVGAVLFLRGGSGMELTAAGRDVLLRARRILADADALAARRPHLPPARRALRVGLLDEGLGPLTAVVGQAWQRARPDCLLVLMPIRRPPAGHALLDGTPEVDLVVGDDPPPDRDDVRSRVAYAEDRVVAVPRWSGYADAATLAVADVVGAAFPRIAGLTGPMSAMFLLDAQRGEPARTQGEDVAPEIPDVLASVAAGTVMTFTRGVDAYRHPGVRYVPLVDAPPIAKRLTWRHGGHEATAEFAALAAGICAASRAGDPLPSSS